MGVKHLRGCSQRPPTLLEEVGPVLFEPESKAIRNPSRRFAVSKSGAEGARLRNVDM